MRPALLLIDVQKGIDDLTHWGGNRNNPEAEGNIKLLLTHWRLKKFPIFIIKHCSTSATSPLRPGQSGNDLKDFITPVDGEIIVNKKTANAFINTDLHATLKEKGVTEVVISGFVTNNSVEATARMAGEMGYRTTVLSDATACFNKKGLDETIYSSELIHQISLSNLKGEYAEIKSTMEVLKSFGYKNELI